MKRFLDLLPFVLLIGLCPLFYYSNPSIAQSIIICAISVLCGFNYYIINKETPNYLEIFENRVSNVENVCATKVKEMEGMVVALREDLGKSKIAKEALTRKPAHRF